MRFISNFKRKATEVVKSELSSPCSSAGLPVCSGDGKKRLANGMITTHRLLTPEEINRGKKTEWDGLEIHGGVKNISPTLWSMSNLTTLIMFGNNLSRVPSEICKLERLSVLDLSYNDIRTIPSELGNLTALKTLRLNMNQIRFLPFELGKLEKLEVLDVEGNPLSQMITGIFESRSTREIVQFLKEHLSVTTNPPPERDWISVRHYDPEKHCAAFTILSYNILSDRCTQRLPYTSCPPWALSWDYRCAHIVKEIKHYEADIFTLQEVETEDFYAFFSDEFKDLGYDGIYSPRARARTMEEEGRKTVDGCAIFWKRDKFEFKYQHTIEFTQVLLSGPVTITNRVLLDKLLPRDNIALCAVLIVKEDIYETKRRSISSDPSVVGYPLLVCTAHIYWDPTFSDIKLIQSMVLMKELTSFLCKIKDTFNCRIDQFPLVLCGDFNSLPDSGLIEFITSGSVLKAHNEFNSTYDECLEELTSEKEQRVYTHDLKLYNAIERGYLEFTNYTLEFRGMIDYIFASSKRLTRLGFLGSVSQNWITENHIRGFPYIHVPSDHIPIMAQFEILPIDDFPYD